MDWQLCCSHIHIRTASFQVWSEWSTRNVVPAESGRRSAKRNRVSAAHCTTLQPASQAGRRHRTRSLSSNNSLLVDARVIIASNQATQEGRVVNSRMIFSNRFRGRVSSRTQRTSEPAATAAAVKTMMRCVVVCGLLLGGLQFSTAPSITFCVAVKLSGTSITAQSLATGSSEHKPKREVEAADTLPIEETKLQSCYQEFVKKYTGAAVENVPGVQLPLPRWNWLDKEVNKGYKILLDWGRVQIDGLPSLQALSPCTRNGLEFAIRQKFEKQLVNELDESQKTVIYLLIEAGFNRRPKYSKEKRGFEKLKHELSNISTPCDKSSDLWKYLENFKIWKEEKEDFCRQINNLNVS